MHILGDDADSADFGQEVSLETHQLGAENYREDDSVCVKFCVLHTFLLIFDGEFVD